MKLHNIVEDENNNTREKNNVNGDWDVNEYFICVESGLTLVVFNFKLSSEFWTKRGFLLTTIMEMLLYLFVLLLYCHCIAQQGAILKAMFCFFVLLSGVFCWRHLRYLWMYACKGEGGGRKTQLNLFDCC